MGKSAELEAPTRTTKVVSLNSSAAVKRSMPAFFASLIVLASLLLFVFFSPTEHDRKSFFSACIEKHKRLKATTSPRLILTGGSNVTLGVDTEALQKNIAKPVVSTSSNILLGLDYMLHEIESDIRPRDTIVVIPEYEHWLGEYYGSESLMMMPSLIPESALWVIPSYYRKGFDYVRFGKHFHSAAKERFKRLLGFSKNTIDGNFRIGGAFNKRGDYIQHLDLAPKKFDLLDKDMPDLCNADPYCFKKFNAFIDVAKSKGATVIVLPPVTTEAFCKSRKKQLDAFWKMLSSQLRCQVITDYNRQALPDTLFWDCKYHPRRLGREERTENLSEQLKQILQ